MNKYFSTFLFLISATVQLDAMVNRALLDMAIDAGKADAALTLIKKTPARWLNQLRPDPVFGITALMRAVHRDNAAIVKGLLERGVNVNVVDHHGKTALLKLIDALIFSFYFSPDEFSEVIQLLLNHGATFDHLSRKFEPIGTPLLLFSTRGYAQGVQMLLDAAATPSNDVIDDLQCESEPLDVSEPPLKKRKTGKTSS